VLNRSTSSHLTRLTPWLIASAILLFLYWKIPLYQFLERNPGGSYISLAFFTFGQTILGLMTDGFALFFAIKAVGCKCSFWSLVMARSASYSLGVFNYALGQGGFGYCLKRLGMRFTDITNTLALSNIVNVGMLLLVGAMAVLFGARESRDTFYLKAVEWLPIVTLTLLVFYLVILKAWPRFSSRSTVLAPLLKSGIRGHCLLALARLPHILLLTVGHWGALSLWKIHVPLDIALTFLPLMLGAAALPISPAGLGTTQAAEVLLFSSYAVGTSPSDRMAITLGFSLCYYFIALTAQGLIGVIGAIAFRRHIGELRTEDWSISGTVSAEEAASRL
jgi:hypothetical protein